MTAKVWCAISKAVEIIKTAQNVSVGRAQARLIEACAAGNVRSRVPSSANPMLLMSDDGITSVNLRPLSVFRKRAPGPVSSGAWKDAAIDGDVLVDADHYRRGGIEISIADLEFELKQSAPPDSTPAAPAPISRSGGRPSDRELIIAEARRRLAAGESMPSSLAAFARELHFWLDRQPRVFRKAKTGKVLGPASIEDHIRPLWRKYRGE